MQVVINVQQHSIRWTGHMVESHTPKVLIVEDNRDLLLLYAKSLAPLNYEVDPVMTLANARELIYHRRYDVIICDMRLGGEHGTDLLRELATPTFSETEVIIVSGEDHYRGACEQLGFDLFLSKPVSILQLRTLVERLIKNRIAARGQV
jgi:DNA-binding NtrC family response regulator